MNRPYLLAAAALVFCWVGYCSAPHAQQPVANPELVIAKQLLSEATDRVITLGGQLGAAQGEIARLKAEIEKAKTEKKDP